MGVILCIKCQLNTRRNPWPQAALVLSSLSIRSLYLLSLVMLNLHNFLVGFRYCCLASAVVATVAVLWLWLWPRVVLWAAKWVVLLLSVTNLNDLSFLMRFARLLAD